MAQDKGTVDSKPLPPLANPTIPDRRQGAVSAAGVPAAMPTRVLSF